MGTWGHGTTWSHVLPAVAHSQRFLSVYLSIYLSICIFTYTHVWLRSIHAQILIMREHASKENTYKCQQETHYHKHPKSTWNNSQHVKIVYVAYALIAPVLDNFPHNPVVTLQHCIKNVYIVPGEKCYGVGSKASWTSSTPSSGCWKICSILSVGP